MDAGSVPYLQRVRVAVTVPDPTARAAIYCGIKITNFGGRCVCDLSAIEASVSYPR